MAQYTFLEDRDRKCMCVVDAETGRLLARLLLLPDLDDGVKLDIAIRDPGRCRRAPMLTVQTSIHDHDDTIVSPSYCHQDWEDAANSIIRAFREKEPHLFYDSSWEDISALAVQCLDDKDDTVAIGYPRVDGRDLIEEHLLALLRSAAERMLDCIKTFTLPTADDEEREYIQEWMDHFWDDDEVSHDE